MEANDPADADDTIGGDPKLGASAPSKGKHKGTKPGKGRRVPSATKYLPESRPWVSVRVDVMKRIALILLVTAGVVYLRSIPTQYIPEAFQDRVGHAMPHWLNSSMHLLNGLPALNTTQFGNTRREIPSPGAMAKQVGRTPHHPVVIIPGFVSSGLELWEGLDCGRHFFRQRMWGTPAMARAYFTDRACWMQHMRLDPVTGLDPAGIKLRAVTGLEAVDWFVPGYFVWGKVIESLGDVGYDPNSIHAATFDWRLSPEQLEKRDGYFTRLKASIETLHNIHKEKVALLAHSYGDQLVRYFFNWVEMPIEDGGGGGGSKWTDTYVAVYVDIAGPMLGIPKTVPSLLSGEMRDTAMLGQLESVLGLGHGIGGLVSGTLTTVASTFRTWGSLWAMLPRGGVDIWGGGVSGAPDDVLGVPDEKKHEEDETMGKQGDTSRNIRTDSKYGRNKSRASLSYFISMREETEEEASSNGSDFDREEWVNDTPTDGTIEELSDDVSKQTKTAESKKNTNSKNLTVTDSLSLLFDRVGEAHPQNLGEYRDVSLGEGFAGEEQGTKSRWGLGESKKQTQKPSPSSVRFGDPLRTPLPTAPDLKVFCLYGVGKSTERAYHYVKRDNADRPYAIDVSVTSQGVDKGVALTDGDGSIPLMSLGYVCAEAWRDGSRWSKQESKDSNDDSYSGRQRPRADYISPLNPSGSVITIREYEHKALGVWGGGIQEGPASGDHVNIMGNVDMIRDVIDAVTGHGGDLQERVFSDVFELAGNVRRLREARKEKEQDRKDEL